MKELLTTSWPYITAGATLALTVLASIHVVIYKRDSRAAVGWVGLIWLAPVMGAVLYMVLGINRVRRKAAKLPRLSTLPVVDHLSSARCTADELALRLPPPERHLAPIARLNHKLTGMPLLEGNAISPLINGDEAYPAMLTAIDQAQSSITLTTYIFGNDSCGRQFVDSLARAVRRGVEVRVLIDSVGSRYSLPPVTYRLRLERVNTACFMPTYLPWSTPYLNLRSHRKIMVVDGTIGFTGGMNIREGNMLLAAPLHPTQDIHFRIEGPVVQELQESFVQAWHFTTGETLSGPLWFPSLSAKGDVIARGIPDGPDKDYDKMRLAFHGALSVARESVAIMTPYFLPDAALITALNTAAMRGVRVDILIPEKNNLRLVEWACQAQLWQILEWGCHVYLNPPPFDHSKLLLVDRAWSMIGSANWDPRSLRLNFEFGVECYSTTLAEQLHRYFDEKLNKARALPLDEVNSRALPIKIRDGLARLFSPYL
jgi:cardiolipin synthase A/B